MLSSTVPAHRMCQISFIAVTFMDAALQPDEGSSALKCRACAQNVSDRISSFYILRRWSTHRCWANRFQVPCLRTECVRRYSYFISFRDAALRPDEGSSALKYRACAKNVLGATTVFSFWDAALRPDKGKGVLKYRACAQNVSRAIAVFSFMHAGPHQDEGSSSLSHRACAQNVSDVTHCHSLYFLGG